MTNTNGDYEIAALPPGSYSVQVEIQGFQSQVAPSVVLAVSQNSVQNFGLQVASANVVVTVEATQPVIDSTTITVGQVIDKNVVQEIPLNGRHFVDLALLAPGTVTPPQSGFLTAPLRGQGSFAFNSAGGREDAVNFMINGVNLNDMVQNQVTFQPTINTVSEFKIDNSTYSAEFGRNSGSIVNIATRSGSNQFHGEAYDYLRNNYFDARNFFNPTSIPQSALKRNQFGGDVGGPIFKEKTFFFASYEGLRQRQGLTTTSNVLTDAERTQIQASGSPAAQGLLQFIPAGNGTLTLSYAYQNDAGVAKTGSLNIAYRAMPPHLYVAQLTQLTPPAGALYDCLLNTDGTLSTCAQTGTGISAPTGIVFNGSSSAYVTDYGSSAVYLCNVGIDGSLSGCASEGSNFQNPLQLAINGNTLYATNANPTGGVTTCSIGVNGTLSLCTQSSGLGTAGIAANASFAYVSVDPTTVDVCAIGASGGLANCASAGGIFSGAYGITLSGGYAYIANQGNGTVSVCSINPVGTFAACAASNIGGAPTDVVIKGSQAYVNDGTGNIDLCSVDAVGAMTNCVPSNGGTSFSFGVQQIAIH